MAGLVLGNPKSLPGPLVCALFFIVSSPLEWTKMVVVLDGCSDGSNIIDGRVHTFGLFGNLVLALGNCDLLVVIRDVGVVMSLRHDIDSLVYGSLIILWTWLKG